MWKSIRKRFKRQKTTRPVDIATTRPDNIARPEEITRHEIIRPEETPGTPEETIIRMPEGLPQKRFRVLILGPANAGKTTLLQRLSDSPAGEATMTRNGQRIKEVPRGYDQRGIHDINDEITYASNPGFVFHDSGGFEAGGVEEVEAVWNFIRKRSLSRPSEQLHAIWLCIPTDNDRPFGFLNSGFFSESTGSVPVIGIFTKLDGRETKVMTEVLGPDPSLSDLRDPPPKVKQKINEFVNGLETQFREQWYPPAAFIRVGNMHEDAKQSAASCIELLKTTMDALPRGTQKLLLGHSAWKKIRWAYTVFALRRVLANGAEENIVMRNPAIGEDEESELRGDEAFRNLMPLFDEEWNLKENEDLEKDWWLNEWWLDRDLEKDWLELEEEWDLEDEDEKLDDEWKSESPHLDYGSKACAPLLKLSRQPPITSNATVRYLTFICLVVLRIRRGRNVDLPDAPEADPTTRLVEDRVKDEFGAQGNGGGLDPYGAATKLVEIIDDYTPL